MALLRFKAPTLPFMLPTYDQARMQELVRVLGIYFNQLDAKTDNYAASYAARYFYPGERIAVMWSSGEGTPEGAVTAPVGSLWTRTDGGANTTLYVKESGTGNTGWVAK